MKMHAVLAAILVLGLASPALAQAPATPPRTAPGAPSRPASQAPSQAAPARPAASEARIDINHATEQQLDALPGVGPVRAKAIIAGRPYTEPQELVSKKALAQSVYDGIKDRIALANINSSAATDMVKVLPGIGDVRAAAIVSGRPYAAPNDLVTKGVLTEALYDRIKNLVAY